MPILSSRVWLVWTAVVAVGSAGFAQGVERAEAATSEVPLHPLVVAAETLYQRSLPEACDELLKLASMASGLTDDDLIRIFFLATMRDLDEQNELGARRALSQALQLDRAAAPPPSSSAQLRALLDEVRAQLPPARSAKSEGARLADRRKAASAREPAPRALLRAVDALYANLQVEGAGAVLELARSSTPLAAADRAQLVLRRGILAMESSDESEARTAFREALEAEPGVLLPDYAPPRTRGIFEEVKLAVSAPAATPALPPAPAKPAVAAATPHARPGGPAGTQIAPLPAGRPVESTTRTWGLAVGGAGAALILGGAMAGAVALSAYEAEKSAAAGGDREAYVRNRDTAGVAVTTANTLYGVGSVALGVGTLLFLNAGDVKLGAGAGKGKVSVTVGGNF